MKPILAKAWDEYVRPLLRRPRNIQVAALCYRKGGNGKEVLLITTRGTGRWMLPKGWPMDGKTAAEAAEIEAWEEAGVEPARVGQEPVGSFDYLKVHDEGLVEPCSAKVFPIKVAHVSDDFPEKGQRQRRWVPIEQAVEMVEEEGLKQLLRSF